MLFLSFSVSSVSPLPSVVNSSVLTLHDPRGDLLAPAKDLTTEGKREDAEDTEKLLKMKISPSLNLVTDSNYFYRLARKCPPKLKS